MWDDHDIFDGWGSYPHALLTCSVFQGDSFLKLSLSSLQAIGQCVSLLPRLEWQLPIRVAHMDCVSR